MHLSKKPNAIAVAAATMICVACSGIDNSADAYLDQTNEPLVASADGRLADLGLTCRLGPSTGDGNLVEIQIENHSEVAIEFLTRGTPWDNLSPSLSVSLSGRELPYMGIIASRGAPSASDFQHVGPGEMVAQVYDVAMQHRGRDAGEYKISLKQPLLNVRVGGGALAMQHDCGVLYVNKQAAEPERLVKGKSEALIYPNSSCSATEQAQIERMEVIARTATNMARSFLGSNSSLYRTWFGTWSTNNSGYADQVLSDIEAGWNSFEGDCNVNSVSGCSGTNICAGANAWVCLGDDPDRVHICSGFFDNPTLSIEAWSNQVGILVHEKSHLVSGDGDQSHSSCTDNGDTACYGAPDARALASNAPSQAIRNGENYEKFVAHAYFVSTILPIL